jgi:uncharacterized protein HemX
VAEQAAEKPPFDPTELLGKLEKIVNGNKSPAGGGKSWISTLIIIAVVLAGLAVWSWISFRRNAELAKLRHEKEVQRIQAEKAAVDAKVAKNDAVVADANKKIATIEEHITHVDADIRAEEERYAADLRAVGRIRSWNDVVTR